MTRILSRCTLAVLAVAAGCSNPYTRQPPPVTPTAGPAGSAAPTATPANPGPAPTAGTPVPANTTPPGDTGAARSAQDVVDLAGEWIWTTDMGGALASGMITLRRSGATYSGQMQPEGSRPANVRSVAISGDKVTIRVDAPAGEAVLEGNLSSNHRALIGMMSYSNAVGRFTASKN